VGAIKRHFGKLRDPRVRGRSRHLLIDIIVLAICGVIGNCDDWSDIVLFAQKRKAWFKHFLKLPNGIPSHDTFERVFAHIDPRAFERCSVEWLSAAAELLGTGQIAIDGKTLCGSRNSRLGPLHLVSAWSANIGQKGPVFETRTGPFLVSSISQNLSKELAMTRSRLYAAVAQVTGEALALVNRIGFPEDNSYRHKPDGDPLGGPLP